MDNSAVIPELKGKKILIVEDDDVFRQAMTGYLRKKGLEVSFASNGKIAKERCLNENFDLIVSDVQMPQMNGIDLLRWVKTYRPMPFVLITGFSNLLETETAFQLGADDFIAKPFRNADLIAAVVGVLVPNPTKGQSASIEQFDKIELEQLMAQPNLLKDLYIRLSDLKLVRIAQIGDELTENRIQFFKNKGLKFLYSPKLEKTGSGV